MAPSFTWIMSAALALAIITINCNIVAHAAQIVVGDCLSPCKTALRATIFFGDLATPLGYEEVTAICPGSAAPQPCERIPTPPIVYNPSAQTFNCCVHFRVVTGPQLGITQQTSVVLTYDAAVVVTRLTVYRRAEGTDNTHVSCIEPPRGNPYRTTQFDSPVVIPVGDPRGVYYTWIDRVEACYYNEVGTVSGDPRVVGGDGVAFYFHGHKDRDYCFVTDAEFHVNAHFIGKRPEGRSRDFTWVQALGFISGPHTFTIAAKRVAHWDAAADHLEFSLNNEPLAVRSSWESPAGEMKLTRTGRDAAEFEVSGKASVSVKAVAVGQAESDAHGYGVTPEDCLAHLDVKFRFHELSARVDGVLGQTYRPGFVNPMKRGVAMAVMGGADRFASSWLLAADCQVTQYATAIS